MIRINPYLDELRQDIERAQVAARYARSCALELELGDSSAEPHTPPHDYTSLALRLEAHVLSAPAGALPFEVHLYDLAGLLRTLDSDMLTPRGQHSIAGAALHLIADLLISTETA